MISYQKSKVRGAKSNAIDIKKDEILWGRVIPYRDGFFLSAKPNKQGEWTLKRYIQLDITGTKNLIEQLAK